MFFFFFSRKGQKELTYFIKYYTFLLVFSFLKQLKQIFPFKLGCERVDMRGVRVENQIKKCYRIKLNLKIKFF